MNYPFELPAPVERIEVMGEHMTKHHLANGQVIHHFTQADTGPPHDHPFNFDSTILHGGYEEEEYVLLANGSCQTLYHTRLPGQSHSVKASTVHRITALLDHDCWTIISPGRKEREPGFYRIEDDCVLHRLWNGNWKLLYPNPELNY